jgi:hypothetical protein
MILVYFVAGAGGYQVRSMGFGIDRYKDFHLKSNLRNQDAALRYAYAWVKHTGKKMDNNCYIVPFPCFAYVGHGVVHAAKVFLSALQDDRIYTMPEVASPICTSYDRYFGTIAKILDISVDCDDMQKLIRKINTRSQNIWLDTLLLQCRRQFNASGNSNLLAQWVRT